MVRFHPARKCALAIGSYEGGVIMFDIQTKKKLFSNNSAHEAPVRDISMFDSQDVFVSCGYDAKINVYDLRRSALIQQHKQAHPMSSICVSSCGTFCMAGNLKGECIAYDFRNMSKALALERIHDSPVVRVAFVPSLTSGLNTIHDSVISTISDATVTPLYKSAASFASSSSSSSSTMLSVPSRDSKFIEMETPKPKSHDSWSELMQAPKMHDFSTDSVMQTPSQWSFMSTDTPSTWQQSRFVVNQSTISSSGDSEASEHKANKVNKKERLSSFPSSSSSVESKRRRMTEVLALEGIEEEGSQIDKSSDDSNAKTCARNVHDHEAFATGFAAFIQKHYDNNNDVDMDLEGANDLIKQPKALSDNGWYFYLPLNCFCHCLLI